ncbi:MAG: hypothetical protein U0793_31820 [Gemmataceae bacterium]
MLRLDHVSLEPDNGGIVKVRCERCREPIGRLQAVPPSGQDDALEWEEKVQGEIDVVLAEHQELCPGPPKDPCA